MYSHITIHKKDKSSDTAVEKPESYVLIEGFIPQAVYQGNLGLVLSENHFYLVNFPLILLYILTLIEHTFLCMISYIDMLYT